MHGALAVPILSFTHNTARSLQYAQNPEQLALGDTGDVAGVAVLSSFISDRSRAWWEYQNAVPGAILGYAIRATHTGAFSNASLIVNVTAVGDTCGDDGSVVFVTAFNNAGSSVTTLQAGESAFLYRNDAAASAGAIFSGVIDFEVTPGSGGVLVQHIAYVNFTALLRRLANGSLVEEGYITRTDAGPDYETRVYKGVAAASSVTSSLLLFQVDDSMPDNSSLPVAYTPYDVAMQDYTRTLTVTKSFTTNDNPASNPSAVASDVVPVLIPGWGWMNPLGCCDAANDMYNWGNWGIVYHMRGAVMNSGTRERRVTLTLTAEGCLAPVAYRTCGDASCAWQGKALWQPGDTVTYMNVSVPAGSNQDFDAWWVLGGPACGGQQHAFVVWG